MSGFLGILFLIYFSFDEIITNVERLLQTENKNKQSSAASSSSSVNTVCPSSFLTSKTDTIITTTDQCDGASKNNNSKKQTVIDDCNNDDNLTVRSTTCLGYPEHFYREHYTGHTPFRYHSDILPIRPYESGILKTTKIFDISKKYEPIKPSCPPEISKNLPIPESTSFKPNQTVNNDNAEKLESYSITKETTTPLKSESSSGELTICSTPKKQFTGSLFFQDSEFNIGSSKSLPPWFFRNVFFCNKKRRRSDLGIYHDNNSSVVRGTIIIYKKLIFYFLFFIMFQGIQ